MPDASATDAELTAAYLLQYLALQASGHVRSYFVDLSLLSAAQQNDLVSKLLALVTYIDTDLSNTAIQPVLKHLGVASVEELIPNVQGDLLQKAEIFQVSLKKDGYTTEQPVLGSLELWNFSEATELFNWYAGNACTDLSVLNRALTAQFSVPSSGEFADFAYHFPTTKDLSAAPLLKLSLGIDGTAGIPYEVQVRLIGKQVTAISSIVLTSGEAQVLYLDLSERSTSLADVSGIRILARPLGADTAAFNIRLGSVTLESTTLSAEELVALISSNKTESENKEDGEEKRDLTTPLLVTVLVIIASIALAAIVIVRHRHNKIYVERSARPETLERQKATTTNEREKS